MMLNNSDIGKADIKKAVTEGVKNGKDSGSCNERDQ